MVATLKTPTAPNAAASPKRRVLQGLAATALSPVATIFIQLGTVPLLLKAWGAAKYGDWILLSAIPTYLGLTNMGLGDASGSDMTLRVGAGDTQGAISKFLAFCYYRIPHRCRLSWPLGLVDSVAALAKAVQR
jgi:hypothetical protein